MEGLLTAEPFVANETDSIDATYEPTEGPQASMIRRAPQTIDIDPQPVAELTGPRVTMSHEKYLELDRTVHELYTLVEIAIAQRDEARDATRAADDAREVYAARLKEWKSYASKLERRLHATQIEELKTAHAAMRAVDIAEEALTLGLFDGERRRALGSKLVGIEDNLS